MILIHDSTGLAGVFDAVQFFAMLAVGYSAAKFDSKVEWIACSESSSLGKRLETMHGTGLFLWKILFSRARPSHHILDKVRVEFGALSEIALPARRRGLSRGPVSVLEGDLSLKDHPDEATAATPVLVQRTRNKNLPKKVG